MLETITKSHTTGDFQANGRVSATPERLMQFAFGYAPPLIIEAAIRFGVFDRLDSGPKTVEAVASASGASVRGLRAVMNALVGLGLLCKSGDGAYTLTPESEMYLVSTKTTFHGGFFRHMTSQLMPSWMQINDIVRTGTASTAVNRETGGAEFFEQFVESLFPLSYHAAGILGDELAIGASAGPVSVLDIASGSGVWGIALAQQSDRVTVTAVDWDQVLATTRKMAQRCGVGDRFRYSPGDLMSAEFGRDHDVATLGHILHSEGEVRSRKLLGKVHDALAPGGTIAIAEFLCNDDRTGPPQSLIFAVNMLVNTDHGDTYTVPEIGSWLADAGFSNVRTLDVQSHSPLILANRSD